MRRKSLSRPQEAAFDDISAFVGTFVEVMDDDTVGFIGNDGLCAVTGDFGAKVVLVVPFICEKRAQGWREHQNTGAAAMSAS
jgi:hypothetical protein